MDVLSKIDFVQFRDALDEQSQLDLKEDTAILPSHHFFGVLFVVLSVLNLNLFSEFHKIFIFNTFFRRIELLFTHGFLVNFSSFEDLFDVNLQSSLHLVFLLLHGAIPVIFYGVISSSLKDFGNLSPLILDFSLEEEEDPFFDFGPLGSLVFWIQMVMPPLPAMLPLSPWQIVSNQCPFLSTDLLDESYKGRIFFLGPHLLLIGVVSTVGHF